MKKDDLLKYIAELGYNIGFGAKKNFATFDIVSKVPGLIAFFSISVGIFALFVDWLATKHFSAIFIILGVLSIIISSYQDRISDFESRGKKLTKLFNDLKELFYKVKSSEGSNNFSDCENELKEIESSYYSLSDSKQILFSDWYAHYKFFWQHQIDWLNDEKQFKFWRDKVPLSFVTFLITIFVVTICLIYFRDTLFLIGILTP